jgi:glycosyltransferase involved in cell wall biosynthesis
MTDAPPLPSPTTPGTTPGTSPGAPPISVVIPAYNRVATIRAAIDSVLRQSRRDFELLVVDDGSSDGTPEAVRAIDDPRLRLIATPRNMGAGAARNLGICEARGTWIAFQDSDDEWLPLKLEKQMARLEAPGAGYVAAYCGMLVLGRPEGAREGASGDAARIDLRYIPNPAISRDRTEGAILPELLRTSLISTQMLIARRDHLLAIGGFDETLPILIDWECALRLAPRGPIAFVDEPLVFQRYSPNSLTLDAAKRQATRMRIVAKHRALFDAAPRALAQQYYRDAHALRLRGDFAAARASLARACRLDPRRARAWGLLAYTTTRSLLR